MTRRAVPVHYLRPNESVWTPPALACFDTETRSELTDGSEVHTLRCWAATMTTRRPPKGRRPVNERRRGVSGEDLAHLVHRWGQMQRTLWIYAHNLHFDLCVSDLVTELGELGWAVTDFAVDGACPFVRLARGDRRLVISDSWSWLPVPLATVANAVGITKPPLPEADDSAEAWFGRCEADAAILTAAMLGLMAWWDANELGRWSITGGSSGWNVMRHTPTHRRILIDPDPAAVARDRLAIYGGRRGQWRTGHLPPSRYTEWDLTRAYTTVCRDLPLPVERLKRFTSMPVDHPWLTSDRYGVIAKVLIETSTPRWPCRIGKRVWYPVGTFWTVLAGPELADAVRRGAVRQVAEGEVHKLGYALRPWAMWCLASQADQTGATPEVAKITLKHWGRTVVGKWAQRGFERVELGPAPTLGWSFTEGWNHNSDARASIVDFGGTRWQVSCTGASDNAYPAILAFVESHVRVALGRVIDAIGGRRLVSCDTDGVLTSPLRPEVADAAVTAARPFELRRKATYREVIAIGPQHATLDGTRRWAGVPASAIPLGAGGLSARLWPKMAWQMRHGRQGAYTRPSQTYKLAGTYAPGWVLIGGGVRPVEARASPDRTTSLCHWRETRWARAGCLLATCQNPILRRYHDGKGETGYRPYQAGRAADCVPSHQRNVAWAS